jgi:glycine C-acetyltransferase
MYSENFKNYLKDTLREIDESGLFKRERIINSPQGAEIQLNTGQKVLNFCANNYLGLADHPEVIKASQAMMNRRGYGMASVRFICGTQDIHKELEQRIADFYQTDDTILYAAAFDANGGVFEPLFGPDDAIISDELNHASIIDGVRLTKTARYRFKNNDMADLETKLQEAEKAGHRFKIIVTDGVFSMDGVVAQLDKIVELAEKYNALTMVDESHAVGVLGATGRGTVELKNVMGKIDIITGTLGKALGGAMGGYTTGRKEIIEMLRQRSRPYLFSNSLAPEIVGGALQVLDMISEDDTLLKKLQWNTEYFKNGMEKLGFDIGKSESPIIPVMLYDAKLSQEMADALLQEGIYVIGFFYPVVPKGKARIRVQLSAAHSKEHLDKAIQSFELIGKKLGVIK